MKEIFNRFRKNYKSKIIQLFVLIVTLIIIPIFVEIFTSIIKGETTFKFIPIENVSLIIFLLNIIALATAIVVWLIFLNHNKAEMREALNIELNNSLSQEKFKLFCIDGEKLGALIEFSTHCNIIFVKNIIYLYISTFCIYLLLIIQGLIGNINNGNILLNSQLIEFTVIILNNLAIFFLLSNSLIFSPFNFDKEAFESKLFRRKVLVGLTLIFLVAIQILTLHFSPANYENIIYISGLIVAISFNFLVSRLYSPFIQIPGVTLFILIVYGTMQTGISDLVHNKIESPFNLLYILTLFILKVIFIFVCYDIVKNGKLISHILVNNSSIESSLKNDSETICEIVKSKPK